MQLRGAISSDKRFAVRRLIRILRVVDIELDIPTIRCQLDSGTPVLCTSPHTFSNVPDGNHAIAVLVSDAAGNNGVDTTNTFALGTSMTGAYSA